MSFPLRYIVTLFPSVKLQRVVLGPVATSPSRVLTVLSACTARLCRLVRGELITVPECVQTLITPLAESDLKSNLIF